MSAKEYIKDKLKTKDFRRPREDFLQESVSQYSVHKDSLCKVSEFEMSAYSKVNLPNLCQVDGQRHAVYWLYRHNLADSETIRENLQKKTAEEDAQKSAIVLSKNNYAKALRNMEVAKEQAGTALKRIRLRRDLCKLEEIFLRNTSSDIEIKETYNSYVNLDDVNALHLYLKSNERLSEDKYQNLTLNLELKKRVLEQLKRDKKKKMRSQISPKTGTSAAESKRLQIEKYLARVKARRKKDCVIIPQKQATGDAEKDSVQSEMLSRSGLSLKELEHVLNQIKFFVKDDTFNCISVEQKNELDAYMTTLSNEFKLCEDKRQSFLLMLDRHINQGVKKTLLESLKCLRSNILNLGTTYIDSGTDAPHDSCLVTTCSSRNALKESEGKARISISTPAVTYETSKIPVREPKPLRYYSPPDKFSDDPETSCDELPSAESDRKLRDQIISEPAKQTPEKPKMKETKSSSNRGRYVGIFSKEWREGIERSREQNELHGDNNYRQQNKQYPVQKAKTVGHRVNSQPKEGKENRFREEMGNFFSFGQQKAKPNSPKTNRPLKSNKPEEYVERTNLPGEMLSGKMEEPVLGSYLHEVNYSTGQTDILADSCTQRQDDGVEERARTDKGKLFEELAQIIQENNDAITENWEENCEKYIKDVLRNREKNYEKQAKIELKVLKQLRRLQLEKRNLSDNSQEEMNLQQQCKLNQNEERKAQHNNSHRNEDKAQQYDEDSTEHKENLIDDWKLPYKENVMDEMKQQYKEYLVNNRRQYKERRKEEKGDHRRKEAQVELNRSQQKEKQREESRQTALSENLQTDSQDFEQYLCFKDELNLSSESGFLNADKPFSKLPPLSRTQENSNYFGSDVLPKIQKLSQRSEATPAVEGKPEFIPINNIQQKIKPPERTGTKKEEMKPSADETSALRHSVSNECIDKLGCEEELDSRSKLNYYRDDISRKMARSYDYSNTKENSRNLSQDVIEEEVLDTVNYNEYIVGRPGVLEVNTMQTTTDIYENFRKAHQVREGGKNNVCEIKIISEDIDILSDLDSKSIDDSKLVGSRSTNNINSLPGTPSDTGMEESFMHLRADTCFGNSSSLENFLADEEMCKLQSPSAEGISTAAGMEPRKDPTGMAPNFSRLIGESSSLFQHALLERTTKLANESSSMFKEYLNFRDSTDLATSIPIYRKGIEIARLRTDPSLQSATGRKLNKSTQMFEHVTENDLYTLQWIHDNLFEININPHTLIVDEKIKEVSEESHVS